MPERRNDRRRRTAAQAAGTAAVSLGANLLAKAARRPVDSLAIVGACALSMVIVINAVFLQGGLRPPPAFADLALPSAAQSRSVAASAPTPKNAEPTARTSAAAARAPKTIMAQRDDLIAELIGASSRITAVQRVLSNFGYGQIKPSGILDKATRSAIEKFEREHKLPVTGRVSDRLVNELAAMTGHPLQ